MSEKTKLWYLKDINILEGLSEKEMKAIAARTAMSSLRKNGVIYFPQMQDLIFKNVRERIITFLLRFAEDFGKIKDRQISVPKFLSQQEIARLTGASRQTVTTIMNDLRDEGVIEFTTKSLTILRPETLRAELP